MSGRIILNNSVPETLSKQINRTIKEARGRPHAFFTIVIEADDKATVHTNMNQRSQMIALLADTLERLRAQ